MELVTGQLADQVRYRGRQYMVTAVDGRGLFDSARFGVQPGALSTACWRGIRRFYTIHHARLTLGSVELGAPDPPPADRRLFGVAPTVTGRRTHFPGAWQYRRLDAAIAFTGRLLVGSGDIYFGYRHMGFAPAWLYERVLDLAFVNGRMAATRNRSHELATVRNRLGPAGFGPADGEAPKAWIRRTFSLTYDYSWPRPTTRHD